MKATELMIGDWVRKLEPGGHTIPVKVTGIIDEDNSVLFVRRDGIHGVIDIKGIEPIPLTDEILTKNIAMPSESGKQWMVVEYDDSRNDGYDSDIYTIDLERCYYGFRCYVNSVEPTDRNISHEYNGIIRYVHELQHALHQCGIEKEIVL